MMSRGMKLSSVIATVIGLSVVPVTAKAAVDFSGSLGALAANVSFDVLPGSQLKVSLTNTSASQALVPSSVLTGVFFNGLNGLTPASAYLNTGSVVVNASQNDGPYVGLQPPGGNVGGEWAYESGFGGPNSTTAGISSTGLGLFGQFNFNGPNLQNPTALDGMQYGIVPASNADGIGNGGMGGNAFIRNSVVFVLSNYTGIVRVIGNQ